MITSLLGSSRKNGNTYQAVNLMLDGIECRTYNLHELNIEKVNDYRHEKNKNMVVHNDDYDEILQSVIKSETVIFATPLYWYSMSASLKLFIDRWSESIRDEKIKNFKEIMSTKKYIVLIIGSDDPLKKSIPLQNQFKYIFDFIDADNYEFIVGNANSPDDFNNINASFLQKIHRINEELKEEKEC